ncbi:hypothetical protein [Mycolicibacterium grossiae]|uniref:Cellulose biosynthesis cyclic di-GMP-binding regulatory protein BcsB n=1 Tax=Mycolicibacterium grossiae TaxID=1552759 RepID=A0A1E8Q6W3_9MYCO|nr:hypothetical protein [Mycolicibacterium grossiae]OFJ54313.1 hypothetical protein BEL07_07810 [Mycolicibacterium grossiae]
MLTPNVLRVVSVGCASALLFAAPSLPAWAEPAPGGQVADAPTLGLTSLGVNADLSLYGAEGTQTLTIPVPSGLAPAALNAVVELPPTVGSGVLTVSQDNRTISRVPLPVEDRAPISIPLAGAEVEGNAVSLVLRSNLLPRDGACLYDTTTPLRLTEAAVGYTGVEQAPRAVADFLPPILQKLTIFVPAAPSQSETDAAVRLTTAVIARYGQQNTDVDLQPLPADATTPPAPSQPFERQVVIREGGDVGLVLQNGEGVPALEISGGGNELINQTRLLSSNLSTLALASKAIAGPLTSSPRLPGNEVTIRQLGQPGVNATALEPQVSVNLDQTRLGRPSGDIRVHLKGSYTPLPSVVGGQVVATVGGQAVDRWPTDGTGIIDRWVAVPNELRTRYVNLDVAVDIAGNTGGCGEFQPVELIIDGATTVQSVPASPPVPDGFESLPQALLPKTTIGVTPESFADASRAVTIAEGLQRLGPLPLDTTVVPIDDAVGTAGPLVLISADGWSDRRVTLPVAGDGNDELTVAGGDGGDPATVTLEPGLKFGSLQTVYDGSRTVLVATSNGDAAQLDSLLEYLDTDPDRWSALRGDAVVSAPDRDPVTVRADAAQAAAQSDGGPATSPLVWVAVAVGVLVVLGLLAWLLSRRRHRRNPAAP